MAGHLKKYGMYWVFSAMTVTGVYVWDSLRKDISAESAAALYNAAMERLVVPALTGDNLPVWYPYGEPTNLFPSAVIAKEFRDRLLDKAVRAAIGVGFEYDVALTNGTLSSSAGVRSTGPLWLLSTNALYEGSTSFITNSTGVASGEAAGDFGLVWTTYYPAPVSNRNDGALCQESIAQPGSLPFPRYAQPTNAPLYKTVLGGTDAAAGFSFAMPAEGCAWNTNFGRVAFSFYAQEKPLDRVLRRRDLVAPAGVLSNLTRTIKGIAVPSVSVEFQSGIAVHSDEDSIMPVEEYLDEVNTLLSYTSTTTETAPRWDDDFAYTHSGSRYVDEPPPNTVSESSVTTGTRATRVSTEYVAGQRLDYPSVYALTNGYVSRVRVYGVFWYAVDHQQAFLTAVSGNGSNSVPNMTYETAFDPKISSVPGFAFSEPLSEIDTSTYAGVFNMSNLGYDFDYLSGYDYFSGAPKLALLYDVSSPTGAIYWTDVDLPTMTTMSTLESLTEKAAVVNYHYEGGPIHVDITSTYTYYKKFVRIYMRSAFVVVDWKWKHLAE